VKAGSVVACEKPPANLWRKLADFTPLRKANYDQVALSCAAVIGIATAQRSRDKQRLSLTSH
jgi:hypothetical protein